RIFRATHRDGCNGGGSGRRRLSLLLAPFFRALLLALLAHPDSASPLMRPSVSNGLFHKPLDLSSGPRAIRNSRHRHASEREATLHPIIIDGEPAPGVKGY